MSAARQKRHTLSPQIALEQISKHLGLPYFRALTQLLCEDFGADIAFVACLPSDKGDAAKLVSLYENGGAKPAMSVPLTGTPCADLIYREIVFHQQGVQQAYPRDTYLKEHEIEGYVAHALMDESGRTACGVIVAMSKSPIPPDAPLKQVLSAVRSRTRAELQHYTVANKHKETISQALLLNYSKSMFMANIGHELKTPIGAMVGYAALIRDSEIDKVTLRDHANQICVSGDTLLTLIGDIMSLAMLEISDETAKREKFDLLDIARTGRRLIQQQAAAKNLTVKAATRIDALTILGDAGHTKKALMNLLTNAVKYTSKGSIEISAERMEDGSARLSVSDSGVGMTEDDIKEACQPLGSFTHAYDMHQEGAGLGLPITMLLLQRQGARLEIESRVGAGTRADIIFPSHLVKEEEGDFI